MKAKVLALTLLLFATTQLFAQRTSELYTGQLNNKIPVSFFLITEENPCSDIDFYSGMYKYDNQEEWIQLSITKTKTTSLYLLNMITPCAIIKAS